MSTASDTFKDQGNAAYKAGEWLKAAGCYTKAIKEDSSNAVLYSNRSVALLKLKKVTKALEDAEEVIRLRPEWEKGYYRKAQILEDQAKLAEALEAYQKANSIAPENSEVTGKIKQLSKQLKVAVKISTQQQATTVEGQVSNSLGSGPVALFVLQYLKSAAQEIQDSGTDFPPELHFLPGSNPPQPIEDEQETHVRASTAFSTPDTYSSFINDMRGQAARFDAQAVVAIIPKPAIEIPQVWLKPGYPAGKGDGVFVQLESKDHKRMWFIPVANAKTPGKPIVLDVEKFAILHNLIK